MEKLWLFFFLCAPACAIHTSTIVVPSLDSGTSTGYEDKPPPTKLKAIAVSPNSIQISWESPQNTTYLILGYQLCYNDSFFKEKSTIQIRPPINAYLLRDLVSMTSHYISVSALYYNGKSNDTPVVHVFTPAFVPAPPDNLQVKVLNSSTILVSWQKQLRTPITGSIRGYKVFYTRNIGMDTSDPFAVGAFTTTTSAEATKVFITGLSSSTWYRFSVAAYSWRNEGRKAGSIKAKTGPPLPTAPRNLRIEPYISDKLSYTVHWKEPLQSHGRLTSYKLTYGVDGQPESEWTTTNKAIQTRSRYYQRGGYNSNYRNEDLTKNIESLAHGQIYELRVSAANSNGYGEPAIITFKTADGAPEGPPRQLSGRPFDEDSVHLSWNRPAKPQRNGKILEYEVQYEGSRGFVGNTTTVNNYIIIGGLKYSTFSFRVRAYTSAGVGPWTRQVAIRPNSANKDESLPPPNGISIIRKSNVSLRVSWEAGTAENIAGYRIFYAPYWDRRSIENDLDVSGWRKVDVERGSGFTLTELHPYGLYAVRMQTKSVEGVRGPLSRIIYTTYQ